MRSKHEHYKIVINPNSGSKFKKGRQLEFLLHLRSDYCTRVGERGQVLFVRGIRVRLRVRRHRCGLLGNAGSCFGGATVHGVVVEESHVNILRVGLIVAAQ